MAKGKPLIVAVNGTPNPGGYTGVLVTLVKAGPYKVGWADGGGKGSAQGERLSAVGRPGPLAAAVAESQIQEGWAGVTVTLLMAGSHELGWADGAGKGRAQGESQLIAGRPGLLLAAIEKAPVQEGWAGVTIVLVDTFGIAENTGTVAVVCWELRANVLGTVKV